MTDPGHTAETAKLREAIKKGMKDTNSDKRPDLEKAMRDAIGKRLLPRPYEVKIDPVFDRSERKGRDA